MNSDTPRTDEVDCNDANELVLFARQLERENAELRKDAEYAWPLIQDYEKESGLKVNDAFRIGWDMARTKASLFYDAEKERT